MAVATKPELSRAELKQAVQDGVLAAYRAESMTVPDTTTGVEKPSSDALATSVYGQINPAARAQDKAEKQAKAVGKESLVASTFPSTPGPSSESWDPDNEIAVETWKVLRAHVGKAIQTDRRGKVQRLLLIDGLVLCHALVTKDQIDSVYVTDDEKLILSDFYAPRDLALIRKGEEMASDLNMVAERIPALRKVLGASMKRTLASTKSGVNRKLLTTGNDD